MPSGKPLMAFLLSFLLMVGCAYQGKKHDEVIIFHAGSLSVPLNRVREIYEKKHPGVSILLEPSGSLVCARKITELKKPCDIIASADRYVINDLLIPDYTGWSISFASNSIVIAFTDRSKYASDISSSDWPDILLRDDVTYARSDPDMDPCGYRSVLAIMLTEKLYGKEDLTRKMLEKNREFIRPKEVDLVALIESGAADYMFQYRSVALQHGLRYIELPDEVNLSNPSNDSIYAGAELEVAGREPGSRLKIKGEYISYGVSILDQAPHSDAAFDFLGFMLSEEGMEIFRSCGQPPVYPFEVFRPEHLPSCLSGLQGLKK